MSPTRATTLFLACALACTALPAGAQTFQDQQRDHYERERRERESQERQRQKDNQDFERTLDDLRRDRERYGSSPGDRAGGSDSVIGPMIVLAIVGALIEYSRRPERQRPAIDYVQETQHQRRHFVYRKCKAAREASLVRPVYQPPNRHALIRLFQSDRAQEFKQANDAYNAAVQELEPTCRCVGDSTVTPAGFSEAEWRQVGEQAAHERPWLGLDVSRVKGLFDACSARSPSDTKLSWLYAVPAR